MGLAIPPHFDPAANAVVESFTVQFSPLRRHCIAACGKSGLRRGRPDDATPSVEVLVWRRWTLEVSDRRLDRKRCDTQVGLGTNHVGEVAPSC